MRKLLFSILLASAAASPALAAHDSSDRQQAREDRQQAREERQQAREERQQSVREERVDRQQNFTREAPQQVTRNVVRVDNQARNMGYGNVQADRQQVREQRIFDRNQQAELLRQQRADDRQQRYDQRQLRQSNREYPRVITPRVPVVSNTPQPGTQPPLRYDRHRSNPVQWNTTWRNNSRYDWRSWRNRHRNIFHLGFYYDPFGWGYQRYSIGYRLWPAYYGSSFWINDPWYYRLPYAPPGTQWIRYYDDALLVDTFTGQVVDVIYDFFW